MNEIEIQKISKEIKNYGVATIDHFLDLERFRLASNILSEVQNQSFRKGDRKGVYPIDLKGIFIKLIKFEFNQIKKTFVLKKIAKDLQLKEIAEQVFDNEVKLAMIDSYYSERSNKHIIDWHCDQAYNGELHPKRFNNINAGAIKFFFYMTNAESANGCLGYIPYSHHIGKTLSSLIIEKKIEYKPFLKLKDLRAQVSTNPARDLIINRIGIEKLDIFLNNSKFIEEESKDTFKFDFEMNKGGVVIFDEFGVHRGSMPSKNSRLILRFFYRKKI